MAPTSTRSQPLDSSKVTPNDAQHAEPAIWCLAELEKIGKMHPEAYPNGQSNDNDGNETKHEHTLTMNASHGSSKPTKSPDDDQSETKKKRKHSASNSAQTAKTQRHYENSQPTPVQILRFLISTPAATICSPADEINLDSSTRTYSSGMLNPFEELLCAVILSRPISHTLSHRSIRTVLNPPYSFSSPKAVQDAGSETRTQAFYDAHTQHKDKTAEETGLLADAVAEKWAEGGAKDTSLQKVRDAAGGDVAEMRKLLQGSVKGLGQTGLDIFFRRVQWLWPEVYPFVDQRTRKAVEALGLPGEADELRELMETEWESVACVNIGIKDEERKKRRAFVVALERAVGADLEKSTETVFEEAMKLE